MSTERACLESNCRATDEGLTRGAVHLAGPDFAGLQKLATNGNNILDKIDSSV
jgi:hypothetical protein